METIWKKQRGILKKNMLPALLFLISVIAVLVCGCSGKQRKEETLQMLEGAYETGKIEALEDFVTYAMDSDGKKIYLLGVPKEQNNGTGMEIIEMMPDGEESKITVRGMNTDDSVFFKRIENGYLLLLKEKKEENYEFLKLKEDGTAEIRVFLVADKSMGVKEISPRLVQFTEDGGLYLVDYDGNLCYFQGNGNLEKMLKLEGSIDDILLKKETLYCTAATPGGSKLKIYEYTKECLQEAKNGETVKAVIHTMDYVPNSNVWMISCKDGSTDFYLRSATDIYGYSLSEEKAEKVCNWLNSDMKESGILQVAALSEQCFSVLSGDFFATVSKPKQQIFFLQPVKGSSQKKTLTLAVVQQSSELDEMVVEYNQESQDTRIVLKDYLQREDPVLAMHEDIISGNVPDMIEMSGLNAENYSRKGLLLDLTQELEHDPEVSEEDFVDSIVDVLKIDGKLYFLPSCFEIIVLAGSGDTIRGRNSWNFGEFEKLYQQKKKGTLLFGNKTRDTVFGDICCSMLDEWIDWEKKTADFKGGNFKKLLSFGKDFQEEYIESVPEQLTRMKDGTILLKELAIINLDYEYSFYKAFLEDMELIGYPSSHGSGIRARTYAPLISITTVCSQKKEAFRFLKKFWERDYQKQWTERKVAFPVRKDMLEKKLEDASSSMSHLDEDGNVVSAVNETINDSGFEVHIGPLSGEDVQNLQDAIDRVGWFQFENSAREDVLAIILEEAQAYFEGDKTVGEVGDILQNRVEIYLNEKG